LIAPPHQILIFFAFLLHTQFGLFSKSRRNNQFCWFRPAYRDNTGGKNEPTMPLTAAECYWKLTNNQENWWMEPRRNRNHLINRSVALFWANARRWFNSVGRDGPLC